MEMACFECFQKKNNSLQKLFSFEVDHLCKQKFNLDLTFLEAIQLLSFSSQIALIFFLLFSKFVRAIFSYVIIRCVISLKIKFKNADTLLMKNNMMLKINIQKKVCRLNSCTLLFI